MSQGITKAQLGGDGNAGLQHASVTLTAAQVKTLGTAFSLVTPKSINGVIIPVSPITIRLNFKTTPYGAVSSMLFGYKLNVSSADQLLNISTAGFLDAGSSQINLVGLSGQLPASEIDLKGNPFQVQTQNVGVNTNPTLGDSPLTFDFFYYEFLAN